MIDALKFTEDLTYLPNLKISFLEKLITSGAITLDQLQIAKIENTKTGRPLDTLLVELGFLSEQLLIDLQAKHKGYLSFIPQKTLFDINLLKNLSQDKAILFRVLPLFLIEGMMHVAVCDPEDMRLFDHLRQCYENITDFKIYIATPSVLLETIDQYYGQEFSLPSLLKAQNASQTSVNIQENKEICFLQAIFIEAVRKKASDIHFEPEEKFVRIRYRIDGVLRQIYAFHHQFWPSLNVRLKIYAQLNVAESRMPQDGRFSLTVLGRDVDFRVSTLSTHHGENIVIRILDKHYSLRSFKDLGLEEAQCTQVKNLVTSPNGIIIVTGPTGSGKTTTLYSMLQYLSMESLNIMTLEEPIEYKLPCIRQTEIKDSGGINFASGVRALLRQDPDVIYIGEIRDEETARMALRASMTGHLVFTTFHTQNVFGVFPRLFDLKLSPALLEGNIKAILSQRLLRKLCSICKQRSIVNNRIVFTNRGCDQCDQTGYQGRINITEILQITEEIEELIRVQGSISQLKHQAISQGFQDLRSVAQQKIYKGETSWEEVNRVLGKSH